MAGLQPAALALDGGDPRLSNAGEGIADYTASRRKSIHDSSVTFEEYVYYAEQTRAEEMKGEDVPMSKVSLPFFGKKKDEVNNSESKEVGTDVSPSPTYGNVSDEDWHTASRAARTATWGAVFYLITTDILGPYSVPWAMAQLGYGPGVVLYAVFFGFAVYSGWQLWQMFLGLDSNQYPLKTYGDIMFRVYGRLARHLLNILQSIQLLFNVGIIIIGNGQGLWQIAQGPNGTGNLCFIVACLIWAICGFFLGQIRTLAKFGWVANAAIWLNVLVIFMTMGVVAHTPPNFTAANGQNGVPLPADPSQYTIDRTGGAPEGVGFETQVVGLMQAVYSYGGAMLFCEFMSEMRRPYDFWKAMIVAQCFIFFFYLMFGLYVYSFQGQYTINPANQGMSVYSWQTAGNVISLVSALIAAALYGNIGIKVLYQNIFMEIGNAPPLTSKTGKLLWVGMVPAYWALAFVIAAAIPQFSNLSALIAAICIMQFSYTFPPMLKVGYDIQMAAMTPGYGFNPATGQVTRRDHGFSRYVRGFKKNLVMNIFNVVYMLGALATCILGCYAAVKGLISGFSTGSAVSSFGCGSPFA